MTLTELKYIVAVARERHFGRAAEACFVSQPTLSVAIKKLEDELGVVIFERGGPEVAITPIGLRIVTQAQKVLEEGANLREIARQITPQKYSSAGSKAVSTPCTADTSPVRRAMGLFSTSSKKNMNQSTAQDNQLRTCQ